MDIMHNKIRRVLKWGFKQALSGIIIAAAVAGATFAVNSMEAFKKEAEQVNSIHIGLSREYIHANLGIPIARYDYNEEIDCEYHKLRNSVIWSAYKNDELIGYIVVINSRKKLLNINHAEGIEKGYLGRFTYNEFSDTPDTYFGSVPADNGDYLIYHEIHYGGNPGNYNAYIVGNYQDTINSSDEVIELMLLAMQKPDSMEVEQYQEFDLLRKKIYPNFFGRLSFDCEDMDYLVTYDNMREYADIIFYQSDWYDHYDEW